MQTIGVIAAMNEECQAVLRLVQRRRRVRLGQFHAQRFDLAGRDIWMLTSGMGPHRAGQAARALIETVKPVLLASVGVAGAVEPHLKIGDVVVCESSCTLEKESLSPLQPLARFSAETWQAGMAALRMHHADLYHGTAVSTAGAQFLPNPPAHLLHPVLEMETGGIAQVARENDIPFLSVRGISDGPQAPLPFELERVMDDEYNLRVAEIFKELLRHPGILPGLLRMQTNTRKAADIAATALVALLSFPGEILESG